jgi:hypothetical protein
MPRLNRTNRNIEQEETVNRVLNNDIQLLDQQLKQSKTDLIHALNADPDKYASLELSEKEFIKSFLGIFRTLLGCFRSDN